MATEPEPKANGVPRESRVIRPDDDATEQDEHVSVPDEVLTEHVLENLPPNLRDPIRRFLQEHGSRGNLTAVSTSLSMTQSGQFDPVSSKITEQHITDVIAINRAELDYDDRQSERDHRERKEEGRIFAGLTVLGVIAVCSICALAAWQVPEILPEIVTGSIGIGAGLVGGYGIGISRQRRRNLS